MKEAKYPELYRDLVDKATPRIAEKLDITPDQARAAAHIVAEVIRTDWAGSNLYLAKGLAFELTQRDRELYRKFTGVNHDQLAREYNLTVRRVYQIVEAVGREELGRQQQTLPFI